MFSVEMEQTGVDHVWDTDWVELIYPQVILLFSLTIMAVARVAGGVLGGWTLEGEVIKMLDINCV